MVGYSKIRLDKPSQGPLRKDHDSSEGTVLVLKLI